MTKKELIEMLSEIPDDSKIMITENRSDLLSISTYAVEVLGYFEQGGSYILSGLNVRPYKIKKHDQNGTTTRIC